MYHPGQIVYDLDKKCPCRIGEDIWDRESYPKRSVHFIRHAAIPDHLDGYAYGKMEIASPETIEEATILLDRGIIQPAPCTPTHCWKCRNWKTNCAKFKTCSEWEQSEVEVLAKGES